MKLRLIATAALLALLSGCSGGSADRSKEELVAADKAFSALSAKGGPKAAFLSVMSRDAKLLGDPHLGAEGVRIIFAQLPDNATLTWEPSFADVSASGELGYTWGRYTMTIPSGIRGENPRIRMGYYVTVWKRQDGFWKVVLDGNSPDGPH